MDKPLLEGGGRGYEEFNAILRERATAVFQNSKQAKVNQAQENTKGILIDNIDKVLQRHTSIEIIVKETESLSTASESFKGGTKALRNKMCWKNVRFKIYIGIAVALLLLVIL